MNIYPTETEFIKLSDQGNLIPVYTDLIADFETPVSLYSKLREGGNAFLFESIEGGTQLNRYSFIGYNPRKIIKSYRDETEIIDRSGDQISLPTPQDPLKIIEEEMALYKPVKLENMPRFIGGAVGFLDYEYIHCLESTVPFAEQDVLGMPISYYMIIDTVIIFDRANQTIRICVNSHVEDNAKESYLKTVEEIKTICQTLQKGRVLAPFALTQLSEIKVPKGNFERPDFEEYVSKCKEYISAGDIIQVVLSQRFETDYNRSPLDLYRALRTVNPSPYMFIFETENFSLVGASPEVHVRLTNRLAETRPIAGTRPRGKNFDEDLANEKDLLSDEKERAEHLMLVDLSRNDLGRVCDYGSVTVPEYMIVERYSHVMHIVSQVEGILNSDKNAYDLMRATFPAGTVSGAPKVRAMQIISELEKEQRGPYAGALGYFSYDGNLDSCITIRTALLKDGKIFIQSGAGLVADSVPANEYQETINKAKGMLKAVALSKEITPIS